MTRAHLTYFLRNNLASHKPPRLCRPWHSGSDLSVPLHVPLPFGPCPRVHELDPSPRIFDLESAHKLFDLLVGQTTVVLNADHLPVSLPHGWSHTLGHGGVTGGAARSKKDRSKFARELFMVRSGCGHPFTTNAQTCPKCSVRMHRVIITSQQTLKHVQSVVSRWHITRMHRVIITSQQTLKHVQSVVSRWHITRMHRVILTQSGINSCQFV